MKAVLTPHLHAPRSGRPGPGPGPMGLRFVAALLLVATAACGDRNVYQPPPPPKVTVSTPVEKAVTDSIELTGTTRAIQTATLRARVEGYLEKILFEDGDRVKQGQLLFEIQRDTYQAEVKRAQGVVDSRQAELELANIELQRFEQAAKTNAVSKIQLEQHRFEAERARAKLSQAEAELEMAQLDLDYTQVSAPFDGRVGRRQFDPGNLVGTSESTELAELNQIDPIYVYFTVDERELLRVQKRMRESAEAVAVRERPVSMGLADDEGYPHAGKLDFAAISVDADTGTLLLRGVFPNPDHTVLPGLFARVRVPVDEPHKSLLVPRSAIGSDQVGEYVLVVGKDDVVERREVVAGADSGELRVIEKGLSADDRVVVKGLLLAVPGRKVEPKTQAGK